jgi:uncharacterized protein (TIGR02217 family)
MFETEFPRKGLAFDRLGGPGFKTGVVGAESGGEQRNRVWSNPRRKYVGSLILTGELTTPHNIAIYSAVETFFLVGPAGQHDSFRFYDELDCVATNEPMVLVSGSVYQLRKTYTLNGRSYVRDITKPITSAVKDYQGNSLADTVVIASGGTLVSVDHTTGLVTLSGVTGTPRANFGYHVPVRLLSDDFEPKISQSAQGARLIKWESLSMIEVRPPNY